MHRLLGVTGWRACRAVVGDAELGFGRIEITKEVNSSWVFTDEAVALASGVKAAKEPGSILNSHALASTYFLRLLNANIIAGFGT